MVVRPTREASRLRHWQAKEPARTPTSWTPLPLPMPAARWRSCARAAACSPGWKRRGRSRWSRRCITWGADGSSSLRERADVRRTCESPIDSADKHCYGVQALSRSIVGAQSKQPRGTIGSARRAVKGTIVPETKRLATEARCRARVTKSFQNGVRRVAKVHGHYA